MSRLPDVLREEAGADGAAAGGGGGADAGKAAGAAAAADAGAGKSVLGEAKAPAAADAGGKSGGDGGKTAAQDADPNALINAVPERLRIMGADGKLDAEASLRAVAKSYTELDAHMKGAGLPPKAATEYEWKPPEGFELDRGKQDEFKKFAHDLGLTKKQFDGLMTKHAEIVSKEIPEMFDRYIVGVQEKALGELRGIFKTEDAVQAAVSDARFFWDTYADKNEDGTVSAADLEALDRIGNNPVLIKVLAKAAKHLKEDKSFQDDAQTLAGAEDVATLMKQPAYFNAEHPDHKRVVARVMKYHEAQARAKARAERQPTT
jgi:hypothetical protein